MSFNWVGFGPGTDMWLLIRVVWTLVQRDDQAGLGSWLGTFRIFCHCFKCYQVIKIYSVFILYHPPPPHHHHQLNVYFLLRLIKGMDGCFSTA